MFSGGCLWPGCEEWRHLHQRRCCGAEFLDGLFCGQKVFGISMRGLLTPCLPTQTCPILPSPYPVPLSIFLSSLPTPNSAQPNVTLVLPGIYRILKTPSSLSPQLSSSDMSLQSGLRSQRYSRGTHSLWLWQANSFSVQTLGYWSTRGIGGGSSGQMED